MTGFLIGIAVIVAICGWAIAINDVSNLKHSLKERKDIDPTITQQVTDKWLKR